jgi:DNA-binding SARP family transcriptional activator
MGCFYCRAYSDSPSMNHVTDPVDVEFRVLGPLEIRVNGRLIAIPAPKQRALIAMLLVHANEIVSTRRIIENLWNGEAPATARNTVQTLVLRVRRKLPEDSLIHRDGGYLLKVAEHALDARLFIDLWARSRTAITAGDPALATCLMLEALGLWRGAAFADVPSTLIVDREALRLDELRLCAFRERVEADLRKGRHTEIIADLRVMVEEHPLHEHFWEYLMLALYLDGRQAEALMTYRKARRVFTGELGLEPSVGLRRLHQRILAADPHILDVWI